MRRLSGVVIAIVIGCGAVAASASGPAIPIQDRARGAERVVVANVADLGATFETNEFGDRLIVSHVTLSVDESLKGRPERTLEVDVLGGTVGDVTLEVSSLPRLARGERAVFFLKRDGRTGRYVPHLRGQGILKLDDQDRVERSSLDLNSIRELVASAAGR